MKIVVVWQKETRNGSDRKGKFIGIADVAVFADGSQMVYVHPRWNHENFLRVDSCASREEARV